MSRRRWSIVGVVLVGLALAAIGLWSALPGLVRWAVVRQIEALTDRQVAIDRFDLDLRRGRLHIAGVRLADRLPGPPLAVVDRVDVRFELGPLMRTRFVVDEAALTGVRVHLARSERGELNIADLLNRPPPPGGPAAFSIRRLSLSDGAVIVEDRALAAPRTWRADGVTVDASQLSTIEPAAGTAHLAGSVAGAPLAIDVTGLGFVPLSANVRVDLRAVDATVAQLFLPADSPVVIQHARLTTALTVEVQGSGRARLQGRGALEAVALGGRGRDTTLASVPSLAFAVDGERGERGARVRRLELTGTATLLDHRVQPPAQLPIDPVRLLVEAGADPTAPARVTMAAGLPGGGQLDVQGSARFDPLSAELRAVARRLDLAVWDAFVLVPGRLAGLAEAEADIAVASATGRVTTRVRGRAAVDRFALVDGDQPVLGAQRIDVSGVDVEWPRVAVKRVGIARPTASIARDREGRISLAALAPAARRPAAREAAPASGAPGIAVEIAEVVASEGTVTLDDASVTPPARLRLSPVSASVRDVSWPAGRPASVQVKVAMPGGGSLDADGTVSLDPVKWSLRARAGGVALAPYQPYVPSPAAIQGRLDADVVVAGAVGSETQASVRGTVALSDLALSEGTRPVIRVSRVDAAGLDYRWPATLTVDRLRVGRSWARVERRADGVFAIRELFRWRDGPPAPAPGAGAAKPMAGHADVTVRQSVLEAGAITFVDAAVRPAAPVRFTGVRLEASDFTWPSRRPTSLRLTAPMPGGGSVSADGHLAGAAPTVDLKVVLKGVDVALARPYVPVSGRIGGKTDAELDVGLALEPFALTARGKASLVDLVLADGDRPLVTVPRLGATGIGYTWPATATIDRLDIERPSALVERRADGALPLIALVRAAPAAGVPARAQAPPASAATPIDVTIRESVLAGGAVTLVDGATTPDARLELTEVRLEARDLAWPARHPVAVALGAVTPGGGRLTARGEVALEPAGADLRFTVAGVEVSPLGPLVPLRGRVTGTADADLQIKAAWHPLALTAKGTVSVANVALAEGDRKLVTASRAEVSALDYAWPAKVTVDQLRVDKPWALVERRPDGTVDLSMLLASPARPRTGAAGQAPAPTGTTLDVFIRRTLVEDMGATIADASVQPASRVDLAGGRLTADNLTWPARRDARVQISAALPGGGKVDASGRMRADGTRLDLKLLFERADLALVAPYLPLRARLSGKADGDLAVTGTLAPPAVSVVGQLAVADAALADGPRTLASIKRLELGGVQADWPRRVALGRVVARQPWSLVERDAQGQLQLFSILGLLAPIAAPEAAEAVGGMRAPADGARRSTVVDVGALVIEDGFVRFVDAATTPRFVEEASRLTLTAERLGTAADTRSRIQMSGQLAGNAPFELRGTVGPLTGPLLLDLEGKLNELALSRLSPYASSYLGWIARRGALDLTVRYRVQDDRLDALNDVVLKQPEVAPSRRGDAARERIGLPLDMLISLLKDARGEVKLSLPVTGVVSSRQFDFGDAVWEGLRKTAINVLALPVSWVGKIFYTEDARIDTIRIWPVTFEAGTTELRRDITAHAERLATFLRDAPGVTLTMKPVLAADDVRALARAAVRQRIDARARETNEPATAVAARLFSERFPDRAAPGEPDRMIDDLAAAEPPPESTVQALAAARVAALRRAFAARGMDAGRLSVREGAVPVEASGVGRVEFDING